LVVILIIIAIGMVQIGYMQALATQKQMQPTANEDLFTQYIREEFGVPDIEELVRKYMKMTQQISSNKELGETYLYNLHDVFLQNPQLPIKAPPRYDVVYAPYSNSVIPIQGMMGIPLLGLMIMAIIVGKKYKNKKVVTWLLYGMLVLAVAISSYSIGYVYGQTASTTIVIEPSSFAKTADVIIFKDGDYAVAINGTTGQVIARSVNHSSVIQEAIDRLPNGGTIFIRRGTYYIYNTITIYRKKVALIGEGWRVSRLILKNNTDMIHVEGTAFTDEDVAGIILMHLDIYGNAEEGYSGNAIVLKNFIKDCIIAYNYIRQFKGYLLYQIYDIGDAQAKDSVIAFNQFESSQKGVRFAGAHILANWWFIGNYFYYVTGSGAKGLEINGMNVFAIIGNFFWDNYDMGLALLGCHKGTVVGNYFAGNKRSGSTKGYGIGLYYGTSYITISSNVFVPYGEQYHTYDIYIGTDDVHDIVISNNLFGGYSTDAIYKQGTNIKIYNNLGYITKNSGVVTVTGDGNTTTFTVDIQHNLTSDNAVCYASTTKPTDAVPTSIYCYLVDTNNDDYYETARIIVKFDTAPAVNETIKIFWEVEVVGR